MPFTLEQKYQALTQLNFDLERNAGIQSINDEHYDYALDWDQQKVVTNYDEADIFDRLSDVERKSEYLVKHVQEVVEQLIEIDADIHKESKKLALKKADKLEWNAQDRLMGFEMRRSELLRRLRSLIGLPQPPQTGAYQQASLGRS